MTKQELRNNLAAVEDAARECRNKAAAEGYDAAAFSLIARLAQIIREEIVK